MHFISTGYQSFKKYAKGLQAPGIILKVLLIDQGYCYEESLAKFFNF